MKKKKKLGHTKKNASHLEKCRALGKMRHTLKNEPHLEKCITIAKMRHLDFRGQEKIKRNKHSVRRLKLDTSVVLQLFLQYFEAQLQYHFLADAMFFFCLQKSVLDPVPHGMKLGNRMRKE